MNKPPKPTPTKHVNLLVDALKKGGISNLEVEYWDDHKHVDIAILSARIYIEVDGLMHFNNAEQIKKDFKRNHFSDGDDFDTIHITNQLIDNKLNEIAPAICEVAKERMMKYSQVR